MNVRFLLLILALLILPFLPTAIYWAAYFALLLVTIAEAMREPRRPTSRRRHAFD